MTLADVLFDQSIMYSLSQFFGRFMCHFLRETSISKLILLLDKDTKVVEILGLSNDAQL